MTFLGRLESVELKIDEDRKVWAASPDGIFSVRSYTIFFGRYMDHLSPWKVIWYPPIPPKVQFFMWTTSLGRFQTIALLKRKCLILTNLCCLCKADEESVSHTLLHSPFA